MTRTTTRRPPLGTRAQRAERISMRRIGLALALGGLLAGCAPLLLGGAMVGGTMMFSDRRTAGTQVEDKAIELKAGNRLKEVIGDRSHVNVNSYNRTVLLTGEAATEADKAAIEQTVQKVDNVRSTVNELEVTIPSALSTRSNDALISGKVRATFIDARDLQVNAFKIVTERAVVYLMGRVTEREAARATELARSVGGVQKVVRVFDIVTEQELADNAPKK
jgi:osmotically-inducible protein OsmY